jgi:hypothetical protein
MEHEDMQKLLEIGQGNKCPHPQHWLAKLWDNSFISKMRLKPT